MSSVTPETLCGKLARIIYNSPLPDPVYIIPVTDGGVISYRKQEGEFIHTLRTAEGFARKLRSIGEDKS
ncbi:MAG: hypothetical protein JXR76_06120 [Deltaproteobacteria bacterium]|nr:hypothetical protein [Deltaproteobacteria bacterium]